MESHGGDSSSARRGGARSPDIRHPARSSRLRQVRGGDSWHLRGGETALGGDVRAVEPGRGHGGCRAGCAAWRSSLGGMRCAAVRDREGGGRRVVEGSSMRWTTANGWSEGRGSHAAEGSGSVLRSLDGGHEERDRKGQRGARRLGVVVCVPHGGRMRRRGARAWWSGTGSGRSTPDVV
ncbi:uncharacterized protein M6B38_129125 [Iris pallida]|uniref:Uncharacterized protein n=1 Tax=Iris pallida TaxID=29817 RepID=A0AAX6G648_IRIPA|nr:uncharacterized protein M6B38_129125 [Iris pallida]